MLDFKEIYFTVPVSFFDDDHSASLMGGGHQFLVNVLILYTITVPHSQSRHQVNEVPL